MTKVAFFSFGRTQSARCPNKMLRSFADTTLTDILLSKLARCRYPAYFAGFESAFRDRCDAHSVAFIQRTERSATIDEPIAEILSFLEPLPFTHFLCMSAALPFLRLETAEAFVDDCLAHEALPGFSVVTRSNHFMTLDRHPLNFDLKARTINTKTVSPVLEFGHALYFFSKDYLFSEGSLWDWQTVRFIALPGKLEAVDVDTEEDFTFAESLWKGMHR